MKEQLVKGIKCLLRGTRPASGTEHGIGKKGMPIAARVAGCLLLIGLLIPVALCIAAQQDPREAVCPPGFYKNDKGFCVATQRDPREAAIAADLAGGTDIAVIIKNAVAAGLSVDRAVEALVTAGAEPGRVAYVAITANFSASDVVKGAAAAIKNMGLSDAAIQTQITTIVSTATQAGATTGQVNSGLAIAGFPVAVISSAYAAAAKSPAPVYGYTAPATPPPTTPPVILGPVGGGGGGGGGLIGGSGVGPPPTAASGTKPASPTRPNNRP